MNKIVIGKIVNTHGLKGELKVLPNTDFREFRYRSDHLLWINKDGTFYDVKIIQYRVLKGFDLVLFEGYNHINLVEHFKGCDLYAEQIPIPKLPDNEYHIDELLGVDVIQSSIVVGKISDVKEYPQGDYLEIETLEGKRALVPFRDEFILKIDLKNNVLEIIEMEGLL